MAAALTASADEAERAMARMLGEDADAGGSSLFAGDDNIRVAARIRPMSAKEIAKDPRQAIKQAGPRSVQCLVRTRCRSSLLEYLAAGAISIFCLGTHRLGRFADGSL